MLLLDSVQLLPGLQQLLLQGFNSLLRAEQLLLRSTQLLLQALRLALQLLRLLPQLAIGRLQRLALADRKGRLRLRP